MEPTILQFLGSGTMFSGPENYCSNMLLTVGGKKLLIDCGFDIKFSLRDAGLNIDSFEGIYVSHLHGDHCGGLELIAFSDFFRANPIRHKLFLNPNIVEDLWEKHLISLHCLTNRKAKFTDYFDYSVVTNKFQFGGLSFECIPVIHIVNNEHGHLFSNGLLFKDNNTKVFISTDVTFTKIPITKPYKNPDDPIWDYDAYIEMLETFDVIFHDCETVNCSDVHPHYNQLKQLPNSLKSKMWLYHTQSSCQPNAQDDGFLGIVKKGQRFTFSEGKSFLLANK